MRAYKGVFKCSLSEKVTYPWKKRKGKSSKSECYMCPRNILALTQQLSCLVAKFGKEIVEYIWKEQNLFSSKRKWKALFYFSFFSPLIGFCIKIFLYCHLNWIDRDNLLFFSFLEERMVLLQPRSISDLLGLGCISPSEGSWSELFSNPILARDWPHFQLPSIYCCISLEFSSKSMFI